MILALLLVACGTADSEGPPGQESACLLDGPGPPGEFVFVGNADSKDLSVVDPRTCEVVKTVALGIAGTDSTASPDGRWVFFSSSTDHVVVVVNVETQEVEKTLETGTRPVHLFFSPDHDKLWVSNDHSASVSVIDMSTLEVEITIDVGEGHKKMALTDGDPYKVYVSNITDGTVSVIDPSDYSVEETIEVGASPHGMDYSSVSKNVYNCSFMETAGIDVIATDGEEVNAVIDRIDLPGRCNYLHIAPGGRYGWAVMRGENAVAVFDVETDTVVETIAVSSMPDKVNFFAGGVAAVAHIGAAEIVLIDMETFEVVGQAPVGEGHIDPETGRGHRFIQRSLDRRFAYVPDGHDGTLSIVDIEARALRGKVVVGEHPMPVAVAGPTGCVAYPR